jgi:hypothetical protein
MNNFTKELMSIYMDFLLALLAIMLHEEKTNNAVLVQIIPYDDEEILLLKAQDDDEEILLLKAQDDDEEILLLKAQDDDEEILLEPKVWYCPQAILV